MKKLVGVLVVLGLIAAGGGLYLRQRYMTDEDPVLYTDPVEHFKYGSYGSEKTGMPLPIWRALPEICKDLLPGGWQELGFLFEPGHDLPVGLGVRKYGVLRTGLNCAFCHSGSMDGGPSKGGSLLLGAPNPRADAQRYAKFILDCSLSDQFTPDRVMAAMEHVGVELSLIDKLVYRYVVVKQVRKEAVPAKHNLRWMDSRPVQGPGRIDTANLFRMVLGLNPYGDTLAGPVDYPSLWNQGPRVKDGGGQHWDGGNTSYRERNYTSAIASGATEESVDAPSIERVSDWITELPPPKYPEPIEAAKAERGKAVWYREKCNQCHDFGAQQAGQITRLPDIGTDPGRQLSFPPTAPEAFKKLGVGKPWHITHYRKTDGYLNVWTDGVWARGPYLHNGSVPTLWELLQPVEQRPKTFYRGCDALDRQKVGWKCAEGFVYDTSLPGNQNTGHLYGTTLPDDEKWALVEYMKTL